MTEVHPWRTAPPGDYAVIGDPVAHSKSPTMHAAAYQALGLNLTYRAIHVPAGEVPEALDHLRELGYRGVNATVPHKEAALAWATEATDVARLVGAANTLDLVGRRAHNTDVGGFLQSVYNLGMDLGIENEHPSGLVVGAGGSAAAVIVALAEISPEIAIWNRTPERAERLVSGLRGRGFNRIPLRIAESPDPADFGIVVNATSASLKNEDPGVDWTRCRTSTIAYDLAYGVSEAPFLWRAANHGYVHRDKLDIVAMDGTDMLTLQGAEAFEWWGLIPEHHVSKRTFWRRTVAENQRNTDRVTVQRAMQDALA